jgi:ketosteroid isomerase-like protein
VTRAEEFEQLRALLFAIAYRILGSVSEAEDAVQETWLRYEGKLGGASPSPALSGKEQAMAEALIRERVEDWLKALNAKDIDGVMSLFAPNLVSFDIVPPLRYVGADGKRRAWQEAFATFTGSFAYEVHELNVTTHGELAFVHSLNHVNATLASGQITDLWLRWTACLRRIDGLWLVVHDHVSVPADLEHGRAVVNLTP